MPIFEEEETVALPPAVDPIRVHIDPPTYDGITIDTAYTPSSAILAWAEGAQWTVDYYKQILGRSSEPTPLALDRPAIYQQYRKIRGMVLKVTQDLSMNYDQSVRIKEITGSGWTFPFLKPDVGDMFIANAGDGQLKLFTITSSVPATILRDSVWNVEWLMVGDVTAERIANLIEKTQMEYVYNHASMMGGCGPFVSSEDVARSADYKVHYKEILKRYLSDFLSPEHSVFLVPDQWQKAYDHFVTRAFLSVVSSADDLRVRKVKQLNVMGAAVMKSPTVFDALIYRDPGRMYGSTERAHLVATTLFRGRPEMQAIGYTGIPRLVYPMEAPTDVESQYDWENVNLPVGIAFHEGRPRRPLPGPVLTQAQRRLPWFFGVPLDIEAAEIWQRPPDIHPVVIDDYYVFSGAFYLNQPHGQSKLELLVRQMIQGEELRLEAFDALLKRVYDWDNLERFYYHPVILAMLKHVMR